MSQKKSSLNSAIIVSKTPSVVFDPENEIQRVDEELAEVMPRLVDHYKTYVRCFELEVLPLLLRAKQALPHGEWVEWYEAFREKWGINKSLRTVQRMFKLIRDGDDFTPRTRKPKVLPVPSQTQAEKDLADAREQLGASAAAGNEQAIEILAEYEQAVADEQPTINADGLVPVPLKELAVRLRIIADELFSAHCLDGFADELFTLAERLEDRQELDDRVLKVAERLAASPTGAVSATWVEKNIPRDRRFQEDMRFILKAGGTTYRGEEIIGGEADRFIRRFTRDQISAEFRNDLDNQLGGTAEPQSETLREIMGEA